MAITHTKHKKGFSLIEVIIVIALVGMILPALFAIIFSILQQEVRIYRLSEVKRQGDSALAFIETKLRTANSIYDSSENQVCQTGTFTSDGTTINFKDKNGEYIKFFLSAGNSLDYQYDIIPVPGPAAQPITNSKVVLSNFSISCTGNGTFAPPTVTVSYTVSYNTTQTTKLPLNYSTTLVLRNF